MNKNFSLILENLVLHRDLPSKEAEKALQLIISGQIANEQIASFLTALRSKGETIEELTAFVRVMRDAAIKPKVEIDGAVDLCGTGGDSSNTFNISTASMFVVAGAGVPVLKHGNRSVSSNSGSADVLEALGAVATLDKREVEEVFHEIGLVFMFAPNFHPAMKHVMQARRTMGIRSFFNTMGPLLNPAGVRRQVVGAFDKRTARQIAEILSNLDSNHVFSVHSDDGLDELSLSGTTFMYELNGTDVEEHPPFDSATLGFDPVDLEQLQGGDASFNAAIIRSIMENKATKAQHNVVLLNATFGIHVSGKADSLSEAKERAIESIETGNALKSLNKFIEITNEVSKNS